MHRILYILFLLVLTACIDPIEFDADNEPPRVVIEGVISNISMNERASLPEDATPFYVKVQYTGPVNNERNPLVTNALVELHDDMGSSWSYAPDPETGLYFMPFDEFAAQDGRSYFIEVTMPTGEVYRSEPEQMRTAPSLESVDYSLTSRLEAVDVGGEIVFQEQEGLILSAEVPEHDADEQYYYRYKVKPSWVYVAPLPPDNSPVKTCYVTNIYYFQKIITQRDASGGYPLDLFFLETVGNLRLLDDFTTYVTQYSMTRESYEFWEQLALQQESGGNIFDPPPFELTSNLYNVNNPDEKVSGFFSVVHESSVRWYINESELPYRVDPGIERCASFPVTDDCVSCLRYRGGSSSNTTEKPSWWREY